MSRSLTVLLLIALAWPGQAAAQTVIHRCVGMHGNPVFTDQPCASLNATPVTDSHLPLPHAPAGDAPEALCAATAADLRQAVVDAFAHRNANRLAGLMLWDGHDQEAVVAAIGQLADAMEQPLLDIQAGASGDLARTTPTGPGATARSPPLAAARSGLPSPDEGTLVLHTAGNDGSGRPRELRFDMVRRAGCLWLRSND